MSTNQSDHQSAKSTRGKSFKRWHFVLVLSALLVVALIFVERHSYSFSVRGDGACPMKLHSASMTPGTAKGLILSFPLGGVTSNPVNGPNIFDFYVFRISNEGHASVAISAFNQSSATLTLTMSDEMLKAAPATGWIIELSVTREGLRCEPRQ
jgi:hypothetical protein